MSNDPIRMLHVSDLHICEDLVRPPVVSRRTFVGAKSHSFPALSALASKLRNSSWTPDLILGTGDITTDGSEQALSVARRFLCGDEVRDADPAGPRPLLSYGLNADLASLLVLPGNHDRYRGFWLPLQQPNNLFEQCFLAREDYPYVVGYRAPRHGPEALTVLFFVFDSTRQRFLSRWVPRSVAGGYMPEVHCEWLESSAAKVARECTVRDLQGATLRIIPRQCVRIAVLHHHPVVPTGGRMDPLKLMENHERFVRACGNAGIHLVLFGHEHRAYGIERLPGRFKKTPFGDGHPTVFLCCPSTSEREARAKGFYTYEFTPGRASVRLYEWNGSSFVLTGEDEALLGMPM